MTTARNRAVDRIHRDQVLALKFGLLVGPNRAEVPVKNTVPSHWRLLPDAPSRSAYMVPS